jgi:hypothetical protein
MHVHSTGVSLHLKKTPVVRGRLVHVHCIHDTVGMMHQLPFGQDLPISAWKTHNNSSKWQNFYLSTELGL